MTTRSQPNFNEQMNSDVLPKIINYQTRNNCKKRPITVEPFAGDVPKRAKVASHYARLHDDSVEQSKTENFNQMHSAQLGSSKNDVSLLVARIMGDAKKREMGLPIEVPQCINYTNQEEKMEKKVEGRANRKMPVMNLNDHTLAQAPRSVDFKPNKENIKPAVPLKKLPMTVCSEWFQKEVRVTPAQDAYVTVLDGLLDEFLKRETIINTLTNPEVQNKLSGLLLDKPPMIPPLTKSTGNFVFFLDTEVCSNPKEFSKDGMFPWHANNMRPKSRRIALSEANGYLEYCVPQPTSTRYYLVEYSARLPRESRLRKKIYYIIKDNTIHGSCMIIYSYEREGEIPQIFDANSYRSRVVQVQRKNTAQKVSDSQKISNKTIICNDIVYKEDINSVQEKSDVYQNSENVYMNHFRSDGLQNTFNGHQKNVPAYENIVSKKIDCEYYSSKFGLNTILTHSEPSNFQKMNEGNLVAVNYFTLLDLQKTNNSWIQENQRSSNIEMVEIVKYGDEYDCQDPLIKFFL